MSVNSSSFAALSPRPPQLSSSNSSSLRPTMFACFRAETDFLVFCAFFVTNLLLFLPLFILILYLGYKQRRKQETTSHSDCFMYHSMAMQLSEFLGLVVYFCAGYFDRPEVMTVGLYVFVATSQGHSLFHLLTCVERYLAVVHPIAYRGLRPADRVRIRNVSTRCVWLFCFIWTVVLFLVKHNSVSILYYCVTGLLLITICFCCVAVLCALKRPGPGEVGGNTGRVDQSKLRAFHTIVAVMGVLLFRFGGNVVYTILYRWSTLLSDCVLFTSVAWFDMPSNLVLPLLFLHRAGKQPQCC